MQQESELCGLRVYWLPAGGVIPALLSLLLFCDKFQQPNTHTHTHQN